jgi:ABC-type multidrug transport system fused ATPase/permease subunit
MNNTSNSTLTQLEFAAFVVGESLRGTAFLTQLVFLVLCVVFRNHQPLKSRTFYPVLHIICKLVEQGVSIAATVPRQYHSDAYVGAQVICFLQVWVMTPLIISIMMVLLFNFVRWILLGMLTRRKERKAHENMDAYSFETTTDPLSHHTQNTSGEMTERRLKKAESVDATTSADIGGPGTQYYKLLQFLLTKKSYVLWISLMLIGLLLVGIANLVVNSGVCYDNLKGWNYAVELVIVLLLYLTTLFIAIVDFIASGLIRLKFSCTKRWLENVYFEDDPLLFRLELLFVLIICTTQSVVEAVYVAMLNSPSLVPLANLLHVIGQIATGQWLGLFASPGIPLFFTILWYIRSKNRDKAIVEDGIVDLAIYNRSEETITQILSSSNKKIAAMFKQFTIKEFSVENVLLYYEIAKYKKVSENNKIKFFEYIFSTYLEDKAALQVNLPKDVLENLKKKLKQVESTKSVPENLWEDVMVELHQNLLDTYSRFYDSKEFKQYLLTGEDKT